MSGLAVAAVAGFVAGVAAAWPSRRRGRHARVHAWREITGALALASGGKRVYARTKPDEQPGTQETTPHHPLTA